MSTYRAVHVVSKGKLELAEKPLLDPLAGHVRIRVEACGVCHSDAITVDGLLPIQYPRVPGHEAVGKIDVIGPGVEGWRVGQRVGGISGRRRDQVLRQLLDLRPQLRVQAAGGLQAGDD